MEIHSSHGLRVPEPVLRRLQSRGAPAPAASTAYADELELSLADAAVRRSLRIAQIQEEIAAGSYDSVERLAAAVYRLVDELNL